VVEGADLPRGDLHRLQRLKALLEFHPVRPDVLHRTGPGAPGNERQVLEAEPVPVEALHDEVMPDHPGAHAHPNGIRFPPHLFDALDAEAQDEAREVPRQEHIAATPEDVQGTILLALPFQGFAHGLHGTAGDEVLGGGGQPKRGQVGQ